VEVKAMDTVFRTVLVCGALVLGPLAALAQSSPIPDSPVPGFGGHDTRPGNPGGSPSASGSAIGSNVGAGASAAPTVDIVTPSTAPATGGDVKLPTGTSGSVTVTR
jgi:hypothetical protein